MIGTTYIRLINQEFCWGFLYNYMSWSVLSKGPLYIIFIMIMDWILNLVVYTNAFSVTVSDMAFSRKTLNIYRGYILGQALLPSSGVEWNLILTYVECTIEAVICTYQGILLYWTLCERKVGKFGKSKANWLHKNGSTAFYLCRLGAICDHLQHIMHILATVPEQYNIAIHMLQILFWVDLWCCKYPQ